MNTLDVSELATSDYHRLSLGLAKMDGKLETLTGQQSERMRALERDVARAQDAAAKANQRVDELRQLVTEVAVKTGIITSLATAVATGLIVRTIGGG